MQRYNLSLTKFEAKQAAQNNCCELCGEPFAENETPVVDHDHKCCDGKRSCGKCTRGLLHKRCNAALGMVEDAVFYAKARAYLERYNEQRAKSKSESSDGSR